jgi:sugar phosphate permease
MGQIFWPQWESVILSARLCPAGYPTDSVTVGSFSFITVCAVFHSSSCRGRSLQSFKLPLFAVFYGLDWIATVPPTVALTARIFGRDRVGLVFGWIFAAHQFGAAVAASFAGTLRTVEGTYDHAFLISGNLCIIAAVSILFIGVRPSRVANLSELGSVPVGS